jgi:NADPH2:quinone reductase
MKEAFVDDKLHVEIRNVPIPKPALGQILIKTMVSGTNPKDWKIPEWLYKDKPAHNSGDDIAGIVEEVGEGVKGFKKGDRVAAFHEMMADHGSFAQYGIAWEWCTFHIPDSTSFEGECEM